ncbi:MAG: hypothetical protein AABY46_03945 [Nitrospirota bacterium]
MDDTTTRETNAKFAQDNRHFRVACDLAGIKPTTRQASKYRRGLGKAYKLTA